MPAAKTSPQKSERPPPSPVKRKKSLARSQSPRGSPTPRAKDGLSTAAEPLRSLSSTVSAKKPPRAPSSHPTGAPQMVVTDSSPSESCDPSPRPSSPITIVKDKEGGKEKERVRVFVRMRPMRESEGENTIRLDTTGRRLWLTERESVVPLQFDFDGLLAADISQHHVYESVARPLVDAALAGFSACLMCYGQTGTGKTYTFGGGECLRPMGGSSSSSSSGSSSSSRAGTATKPEPPPGGAGRRSVHASSSKAGSMSAEEKREQRELRQQREAQNSRHGVVGRALRHVLEWAAPRNHRVCVAYVQVYMELLQDLLRPESTLTLREHPDLGVYVDGAQWKTITNAEAACALITSTTPTSHPILTHSFSPVLLSPRAKRSCTQPRARFYIMLRALNLHSRLSLHWCVPRLPGAEVANADARRTTAFTKLNADSSRSHAVLLIAIRAPSDQETPTSAGSDLPSDVAWASAKGRLFLVDLAGSERAHLTRFEARAPWLTLKLITVSAQPPPVAFAPHMSPHPRRGVDHAPSPSPAGTKRSGVVGHSFDEAISINQSLTTLGRCIQALAKGSGGRSKAPVRESKLTRLLSPCLGGAMTSLVCCCSGALADRFETLSTLEFGRNAMRVLLKPQSQLGVDFKSLTIELQAQLDARAQAGYELEASVEARVRAEFEERLQTLEEARRQAEAARQTAEIAFDRRAEAERVARATAESATADLTRIRTEQEASAKTARASHDSRAAIIATADSLAEEVVRARRDRDEALSQLEMLTSHGGAMAALAGGSATDAEAKLADSASAVEREVVGGLAELAVFRAQVERRKVRARAAAARAVPSSLGTSLMGSAGGLAADEVRVATDRKSITQLRTSIAGLLGGLGEMLAGCVELGEAHHPDLWQGTAEQLTLVDQIRASHRLVHMLGRIQSDFIDEATQ